MASVATQLSQLEDARRIVLGDAALYPQIVQGILPIIGADAVLELRRWGADFLSETFASPTVASQPKEHMSLIVLQSLRTLLENPQEDAGVVKSVIHAATSVYGPIFKYIINNSHDTQTWGNMAAIKSNILRRWDNADMGIRICCVKFVQRVVQLQTPGVVADPRRPELSELSLALVPRDHPLIPPSNLEPEASGLLDRLLDVFHEQPSNAILVTATLNCLGPLVRSRQTIANKIMSSILNFNPLKHAYPQMNTKAKVQIKSVEKTIRMLLLNILRKNENTAFAGRIKQHIERLAQARIDLFDENSRKRGPPEPTDGLDNAKRARLGAEVVSRPQPPSLPPGPVSLAQLYTLTNDADLTRFDVTQLPIELIVKITIPVLYGIQQPHLDAAINTVRDRYVTLSQKQSILPPSSVTRPSGTEDEDDDYEPDFEPTEDAEQIRNKADTLPPEESLQTPTEVALGPFKLPHPPPLTKEETEQLGKGTIGRVFGMMNVLDEPSTAKRQKPGLNRLAGSSYDRDAWMAVITRLATRTPAGLEGDGDEETKSDDKGALIQQENIELSLGDGIRETLWKYVLEDFRVRIPVAISWLNEEWFSDQLALKSISSGQNNGVSQSSSRPKKRNYETWVIKILDGILPYLEPKDRVLIRFLSEIPAVDEDILHRVKSLASDPERVVLAVQAIYYLVIVRPPVREICLDALEDLWRNNKDARPSTQKHLLKWRPHILEESKPPPEPTPNAKSDSKPEAQSQPPPETPAATTNGVKSPVLTIGASDASGEVKTEAGSEGRSLDVTGAGADTSTKTEKGGSVVAAVG